MDHPLLCEKTNCYESFCSLFGISWMNLGTVWESIMSWDISWMARREGMASMAFLFILVGVES